MLPWQPIKFSDLGKIHMNRIVEDYSRNISVKLLSKYLQWDSSKCQFSFFLHCKSMANINCHSNQSSYPIGTKKKKKKKKHYSFPLPIDTLCEIWRESASWLQRRCRLKMLTTDDGRTDDGGQTILLAHLWPWNLVCGIGCSSTTKFVQMMTWVDLNLFYGRVKFGPLCLCVGKKVKQWIFQKLLLSMMSELADAIN